MKAPAKIDLEYRSATSNKFWSIHVKKENFTVTYGRLGTKGQSKSKSWPSTADCRKEADKLVAQKRKKGYEAAEVKATKAKAATTKAKTVTKTKAATTKAKTVTKAKTATKAKAATTKAKTVTKAKAATTKAKTVTKAKTATKAKAATTKAKTVTKAKAATTKAKAATTKAKTVTKTKAAKVTKAKKPASKLAKVGTALRTTETRIDLKDVKIRGAHMGIGDDGQVWFGGTDQGLIRHDGTQTIQIRFKKQLNIGGFARGAGATVCFRSHQGLIQYDGAGFSLLTSKNSKLHENALCYIKSDSKGRVHCVSDEDDNPYEKRISVFDGRRWKLLRPEKEIPSTEIRCLGFDSDDNLLIGTTGGYWYPTKDDWGEALTRCWVNDFVADGKDLWVATNGGVYKVRGRKKTCYDIGFTKGLCASEQGVWARLNCERKVVVIQGAKEHSYSPENSKLPKENVDGLSSAPDGSMWLLMQDCAVRFADGEMQVMTGGAAVPAAPPLRPLPKKQIIKPEAIPSPIHKKFASAGLGALNAPALLKLVRPAIGLDLVRKVPSTKGSSRFGGQPDLPAKSAWPTYAGSRKKKSLPFLMQVNLAEVRDMDLERLLPSKGLLSFFADTYTLSDSAVVYSPSMASLQRREMPEDLSLRVDDPHLVASLPECGIKFFSAFTLPSLEFVEERVSLNRAQSRAYQNLQDYLAKRASKAAAVPFSQLLGWPEPMQHVLCDTEDDIALLQLNGCHFSEKSAQAAMRRWCLDGLIYYMTNRVKLKSKNFSAYASLSYS